jgi:NadR type nicotinamide-nucleotide adenylyltransferase
MVETNAKGFRSGVIVGKFYPLTRGHQYLIERALEQCQRLTISISHRDEAIPAALRMGWIAELYPMVRVRLAPPNTPYYPNECSSEEQFYAIWRQVLIESCGGVPDAVFSSERYGDDLARHLGCRHVCVDQARRIFPVSGTQVRSRPFEYWDYLNPVVRSYFVRTVCVYGPESCGKTTLAQRLAEHYQTSWQPEFARDYLGNRHCELDDMVPIAEGHLRARDICKRRANKLLFVDTDTFTTEIFSRYYYGMVPGRVSEIAALSENQNDFYLLLTPEVPWVAETGRDIADPALREAMYRRHLAALERHRKRYSIISGADFERRFAMAIVAVGAEYAAWNTPSVR